MDIQPLVRAIAARHVDECFPAALSADEWQQLGRVLERSELQAGELLLRRGDIEARAYLIERGQLQVFVTGGAPGSHRIATLREGTIVGEPGLFGATPRLAHVEAVTPCVVWGLAAQRLQELAAESPGLVLEVLRAAGAVMAQRMRANLERGIPLT